MATFSATPLNYNLLLLAYSLQKLIGSGSNPRLLISKITFLVSVIASNKEPVPGWIDSLYGPSGVVVASTTGIMRTLNCDPDLKADVVPVDMVSNTIIASAWHLDNRY